MKSATPKVLHTVAGRSLLGHVIEAASSIEPHHLIVVVGHGRDQVVEHVAEIAPWALTVVQETRGGTGHALRIALADLARRGIDTSDGPVVVLTGDTPLLTGETLVGMLLEHDSTTASATVLTARLDDPTGYGRILRDARGSVAAIVEQKDATDDQRRIDEINSGMYAFAADRLGDCLARVTTGNAQGEEYLTDVLGLLASDGDVVSASLVADATQVLGVNDRVQLARAAAILRDRINEAWMRGGVSMLDPATTWLDVDVDLAPMSPCDRRSRFEDRHRSRRGRSSARAPRSPPARWARARRSSTPGPSSRSSAAGAKVGPFTYLRPGTVLGAQRQGRRVRRDQELGHRRRVEGAAPVVRRATPRSARAPTSVRPPSSSTTTASTSTARSSATTSVSAATPC